MRVAIMQPTYLPWSGYFGLLQSVDLFVYLDDVQFEKRSWQQRNQIKTENGAQWLTVPVLSKGKREQIINEVQIDTTSKFSEKHIKSIQHIYRKSPFFHEYSEIIFSAMKKIAGNLSEYNISIINDLKDLLGIYTNTILSSEVECTGIKSDRLASICSEVGASEYISPPGSKNYLEQSKSFEKIGVEVKYFNFTQLNYQQLYGDFLTNMSVIDLLMNCGDNSNSLIKNGSNIEE